MARLLLLWAHANLRPLRGAHVPGILNQGADMLSRDNVNPGEWSLHPQVAQTIWSIFSKAEVDLFASEGNALCPIFFLKKRDALAHIWPNLLPYAFPSVSMLPQVIERIWDSKCLVLLIAPLWPSRTWFPELVELLKTAPWPITLTKDLFTQADGSIWHPRPDLWALHVWPLNGYLGTPPRRSPEHHNGG